MCNHKAYWRQLGYIRYLSLCEDFQLIEILIVQPSVWCHEASCHEHCVNYRFNRSHSLNDSRKAHTLIEFVLQGEEKEEIIMVNYFHLKVCIHP